MLTRFVRALLGIIMFLMTILVLLLSVPSALAFYILYALLSPIFDLFTFQPRTYISGE